MNNAPRAQEEQRFEERVGEEVEHTRSIAIGRTSYPQANEHVAKLANGGEGQYSLEVGLYKGNRRREEGSETASPGYYLESCRIGCREEREGAGYHIYSSGNHRCRVDQCADRSRAFHGRGQPDM